MRVKKSITPSLNQLVKEVTRQFAAAGRMGETERLSRFKSFDTVSDRAETIVRPVNDNEFDVESVPVVRGQTRGER
jgi:hypothetical protein